MRQHQGTAGGYSEECGKRFLGEEEHLSRAHIEEDKSEKTGMRLGGFICDQDTEIQTKKSWFYMSHLNAPWVSGVQFTIFPDDLPSVLGWRAARETKHRYLELE